VRAVAAVALVAGCLPEPPPPKPPRLELENRVTILWNDIRNFRRDAGMPLDPPRSFIFQFQGRSVKEARHVCTDGHAVPPRCDDVCNLSENICDNAEEICNIANELGNGDEYAQDKCASAKASCREAKQRCCDCSVTPPPEGVP
jgi:hypothetical protein